MTEERMKELLAKADAGTITDEEELELLREINRGVDQLRTAINAVPDQGSE